MTNRTDSMVMQRQEPLRERYVSAPEEARIRDHAKASSAGFDPFHGAVTAGDGQAGQWRFGIHRAIGGDHDLPNPGDILCAALATCLDSTTRMIAGRLGLTLETLEVTVSAFADVRGCLMVNRDVPVGFYRIEVDARIKAAKGTDPAQVKMLTEAAERCCVVLQTLRGDVPVQTNFSGPGV